VDETQIWQTIDAERAATADLLAGLSDTEWAHPSLCEGWTVREVAAHLSLAHRMGIKDAVREYVKARGSFNRMVDQTARAEATANAERSAVLARYQELKAESDRVAAQLRAEADAEARRARASGGAASKAPLTTVTAPRDGAFFLMPVHGWKSSNFGMRFDPVYKVYQLHAGVDLAAGGGQPIVAAADGVVVRAGPSGGNGNYTCISHGLYQGKGLATCYAHQSAILVHVGEHVQRGELIGRVGTTGASTGYHLHFEVRLNGTPVQPLNWLPACLC